MPKNFKLMINPRKQSPVNPENPNTAAPFKWLLGNLKLGSEESQKLRDTLFDIQQEYRSRQHDISDIESK
jgi:hypothetical protein